MITGSRDSQQGLLLFAFEKKNGTLRHDLTRLNLLAAPRGRASLCRAIYSCAFLLHSYTQFQKFGKTEQDLIESLNAAHLLICRVVLEP
jgi:hypothetical protein